VPPGFCKEDVKRVPIVWWRDGEIYLYSVHDVGKPMTSSFQPERLTRTNMGTVSQTWCDYFHEAKERDLDELRAKDINIGNFLIWKYRDGSQYQKPLPDDVIQVCSRHSLDINNSFHFDNPIVQPLVLAENERDATRAWNSHWGLLPKCDDVDSLVAALYFWQYKCMEGLLNTATFIFPNSAQRWHKCKKFYEPSNWQPYCTRFAKLHCVIRNVYERIGYDNGSDEEDSEGA
jgi:hypothetical protein